MTLAEPGSLMSIRWAALATQALTFVLAVVILRKTAWKKILGMLEARREMIRKQVDGLKSQREEADRLKEEYRQVLELAAEEARSIRQIAVASGQAMAREISNSAREEAQTLRARVLEEMDEERSRAESRLRQDLVELATAAAEKALMIELDSATQERIMDAVVREIASIPG